MRTLLAVLAVIALGWFAAFAIAGLVTAAGLALTAMGLCLLGVGEMQRNEKQIREGRRAVWERRCREATDGTTWNYIPGGQIPDWFDSLEDQ